MMLRNEISRLLPFGDKNAMLVIVFLILSLGIGALRIDQQNLPKSPLHPALITLNQETPGLLGIEKLVYLNIDDNYFVDQPIAFPSGLEIYSVADRENFRPGMLSSQSFEAEILDQVFGPNSVFVSEQVQRDNTGVLEFHILDREIPLAQCDEVMKSPDPYITSGGECIRLRSDDRGDEIWSDISARAMSQDYRCFGVDCEYRLEGGDLSFSGVGTRSWNGASISYEERRSFRSPTGITGLICYFDGSTQREFLSRLELLGRSKPNFVMSGLESFRLFSGRLGYEYVRKRIEGNAQTRLSISVFDPNKFDSVEETSISFDGIYSGGPIQDSVVFANREDCQRTVDYVRTADQSTSVSLPDGYPHQIVRLFSIVVENGEITSMSGVDDYEAR